jgi:hypothetical protein
MASKAVSFIVARTAIVVGATMNNHPALCAWLENSAVLAAPAGS